MASRNPDPSDTLTALRSLGYNQVPKARSIVRGRALSISRVLNAAPGLAELSAQAHDNQRRLQAIAPLLPTSLRPLVQSGGMEGGTWCLLVPNSAVAAKLRQTLPALAAHLRTKGWAVTALRVKVQTIR